eukprot:gnl/TRDRNA2_/TRDRNA2_84145_c0_seq1.p1 gnl/TRDRNA2_/TRDRNA2_84145_c0~~gnl/TRDRNA2_/TRDRNA2_84145_c0_seq1.p1  ORF type:complete len:274 (-),score=57.37 gnl/TRDRNA2_/TRDRNA2_84145_c0_seq1:426-1247(-)
MAGLSQTELDSLCCCEPADDGSRLEETEDSMLASWKKKRKKMAGISQLELDEMSCSAVDAEGPPSPIDAELGRMKKTRQRRITMSAMGNEITAISQADLDAMGISEDEGHEGARASSPIGSALRQKKRSRLSISDGIAGAVAKAAETAGLLADATAGTGAAAPGGLSQEALDALGTDKDASNVVGNQEASWPERQVRQESPTTPKRNSRRSTQKETCENAFISNTHSCSSQASKVGNETPSIPQVLRTPERQPPLSPINCEFGPLKCFGRTDC